MNEPSSSIALPLIVIGALMIALMAGGFFAVKKIHMARAESSETPSVLLPPPPPPSVTMMAPTIATTISPPPPLLMGEETTGEISGDPHAPDQISAVARLRPGFRSCYNKGLATDPSMSGNITIQIVITSSGDVSDVTKVAGVGLSSDVESCIMRRARHGSFATSSGTGTTIRVPLTFVQQK